MSEEELIVDQPEEAGTPAVTPVAVMAKIVLKRSNVETDISFPVNPPAVIGRFDPAVGPVDVDLGDIDEGKYVSRKHARIELDNGVYKIKDLGSSNGTFVLRSDFEKVDEAELSDGMDFALGNARFVFRTDAQAPETAEAVEPPAEPEPAPADMVDPVPPELA
jgi:pSer/pThr/pTyr-binding forkhead associated (FHA) protein